MVERGDGDLDSRERVADTNAEVGKTLAALIERLKCCEIDVSDRKTFGHAVRRSGRRVGKEFVNQVSERVGGYRRSRRQEQSNSVERGAIESLDRVGGLHDPEDRSR